MFLHPINATFIVSFAETFAAGVLPASEPTVIPAASAEEYFRKDLLSIIMFNSFI
jgi:hypothetical protein